MINVAVIQQNYSTNVQDNIKKNTIAIEAAAANHAQIIVLPELANYPYFCQIEDPTIFDLAETIPGPSTEYLQALAKTHHCIIVSTIFEKRLPGLYHNTAVVIESDGSLAGIYRKMHIPDDPGYYEKYYFTPGDSGFQMIETSVAKLGVLICWDQWFPEAARLMALAGADMLLYPTAIGWDPADPENEQQRQLSAWQTIQRSHAIANGIPVLSANRVGFEATPKLNENGINFWGSSFIAGPQGEILEQANNHESTILYYTLDLKRNENVRRIWPFLRDRRIDSYQDLNKLKSE